MCSYWLFSIHGLHPQTSVGFRQSLQGDDAMPEEQNNQISEVCCTAAVCTQQHQLVHNGNLDVLLIRSGLSSEQHKIPKQRTKKRKKKKRKKKKQQPKKPIMFSTHHSKTQATQDYWHQLCYINITHSNLDLLLKQLEKNSEYFFEIY